MVGLRAKVLGRLGRTTSPHPKACALSCPSLVVYRAGALRGPGLFARVVEDVPFDTCYGTGGYRTLYLRRGSHLPLGPDSGLLSGRAALPSSPQRGLLRLASAAGRAPLRR